jgi:hypothetical protein
MVKLFSFTVKNKSIQINVTFTNDDNICVNSETVARNVRLVLAAVIRHYDAV